MGMYPGYTTVDVHITPVNQLQNSNIELYIT